MDSNAFLGKPLFPTQRGSIVTEEDRTTTVGLFHYAHSYAASARELTKLKLKVTHPDAPVRFQYGHAIELYLKSFLRLHGLTAMELRSRPYSHDTKALHDKAEEFGLYLVLPHVHTIEFIANDTVDRYIVLGARKVIPLDMMDDTCRSLHERIGPDVYRAEGLTRAPISYG
tara:strand:- start:424 stop:936 length:513 start_codon:yes stop_codon:yes gene_type:complete